MSLVSSFQRIDHETIRVTLNPDPDHWQQLIEKVMRRAQAWQNADPIINRRRISGEGDIAVEISAPSKSKLLLALQGLDSGEVTELTLQNHCFLMEKNLEIAGDIDFECIYQEMQRLEKLRALHFISTTLRSFSLELLRLAHLTELSVVYHYIPSLPAAIAQLKSLVSLKVNHGQLIALPKEIGELTNLTILEVCGNQLVQLPPEIGKLKGLVRLDLSTNHLRDLPSELFDLENLRVLDLSKNTRINLNGAFDHLQKLQELLVSQCYLQTLPAQIGQIKGLMILDLNYNPITSLPRAIYELPSLPMGSLPSQGMSWMDYALYQWQGRLFSNTVD